MTPAGRAAGAVVALAVAFPALTSCGGTTDELRVARPQTIEIDSKELDGRGGVGFVLEVHRVAVTPRGWRVEARITNATPVTWTIARPHVPGGTKFGLFVARDAAELRAPALEASGRTTPALTASRFRPRLPRVVPPGASWAGSFSGPGRIPQGSSVAVAFGRFTTPATPPAGLPARLLAVTRPIEID